MKRNYAYIIGILILFSAVLLYFVSSRPKRPLSSINTQESAATESANRAAEELRVDAGVVSGLASGVITEIYNDQISVQNNDTILTLAIDKDTKVYMNIYENGVLQESQEKKLSDLKVGDFVDLQLVTEGENTKVSRISTTSHK